MSNERAALFIDGSNVHATALNTSPRFFLDYNLLHQYFASRYNLIRAYYYTALSPNSTVQSLTNFLEYNQYALVEKPTKEWYDPSTKTTKVKGNMDIEIAVDMIDFAESMHLDRVFLFSGDGDFVHAIRKLQRMGVRVTVVSSLKTRPAMIADELRKAADNFIEITELPVRRQEQSTTVVVHEQRVSFLNRGNRRRNEVA